LSAERIASLNGDQATNFVCSSLEIISDPQKELAPVAGRHPSPGFERRARNTDRPIDISLITSGNSRDRLSSRWILDFERSPAETFHPLSGDQHLVDELRCVNHP
jgi:hypothetical protein